MNDTLRAQLAGQRNSGQNYSKDWLEYWEKNLALQQSGNGTRFEKVVLYTCHPLHFSFNVASASKCVTIGLRSGSRAAELGLQEGRRGNYGF